MMTAEQEPLVKERLAGQLKDAIMQGRLRPGQRVIEGAWAREFGVAQASVREAINLLISEGFLVKHAGRSARVTQYSTEDVARIYEVRGSLEGLAAQLATNAKADLSLVESALRRMEEAHERGDVKNLVEADLAFHMALAEASGNPVLMDILSRLLRPLFGFVLLRMLATKELAEKWAPDLPHHRQMIEMIRSGSPAIAKQFVEHCVSQFVASAHVVWVPESRARKRKER